MNWANLDVAEGGTHHVRGEVAAYEERFSEVLAFHAPGLAPVRRGADAWHIGPDGRAAYERRFSRTFGFYEELAAVVGADGWHHIHAGGDAAYADRHSWCGNFQGGRCTVRHADGSYGHIGVNGDVAYTERWRYAGDYRDGTAVVQGDHGRSTHIDRDGRLLHGCWFLDLDVFHKRLARARTEAGWTHVDRLGQPRYARRFAVVEPFYNGQARVQRFDGGLEVIDEDGDAVVELRPARVSEFAALSRDLVGFWKTQAIATAVELRVFEALPGTGAEIASRCRLRPGRAERLLAALGELGLVCRDGSMWQATSRGQHLREDDGLSLAGAALEYAGPFSRLWRSLPQALSSGSDWSAPDVFGDVAADEERRAPHHRMLQSYARHDYPLVASALRLAGTEHVIDGGGGLGALAQLLLDTHPSLRITVLDRPEVIAQAIETNPARSGLEWLSADVFEPWGVQGDVVVLARVLHDWDDAAATRVLCGARAVLPPGGRLFVIEMVLEPDGFNGSLCDLHLLVATGGQERSVEDYRRLLQALDSS
ncbi:MAG: methyltransferase [Deltaproteobacteria bacterium]|nr:methyltransferase [Deltaproteobacteria bacterium]